MGVFRNMRLPEGTYSLEFILNFGGCLGDSNTLTARTSSNSFTVEGCGYPEQYTTCPSSQYIVDISSPGSCVEHVLVQDPIINNPYCVNYELSNNYNSDTGSFSAAADYPLGVTSVELYVTGAASSMTCTVEVVVVEDNIADIICPENYGINVDAGECGATVTIPVPTIVFTSQCETVEMYNNFNFAVDASDFYPVGITTVTYYASAGNARYECSFDVTVVDNEPPVVNCPADYTSGCVNRLQRFHVDYSDNCPLPVGSNGVSPLTALFDTLESGVEFPGGITTQTFEVVDAAGLSSQCTFDVTLEDTYWIDADADGYGDASSSSVVAYCDTLDGYVNNNLDCNDNNEFAWRNWYIDNDGDSFGSASQSVCGSNNRTATELLFGIPLSSASGDCNDDNPFIHPLAFETCDNIDNDCDNVIDNGCTPTVTRTSTRTPTRSPTSTPNPIAPSSTGTPAVIVVDGTTRTTTVIVYADNESSDSSSTLNPSFVLIPSLFFIVSLFFILLI